MEKGNEVSNPGISVPEATQSQTNVQQSDVSETPKQLFAEPTPPQNTNKKWLLPSLISLVFIAFSVAGYFAYQNFQLKKEQPSLGHTTPTPTSGVPSPTTDQTADWKTYKNDIHSFTFKYPSDWQVGLFKHAPDMLTLQPQSSFVEEAQKNSIVIAITNHCLNTQCLAVFNLDEMVTQWNATKLSETIIDGVKVYKVSFSDKKSGYMFIKGDDFFSLATDIYLTELNQILLTFKFSEQTNTAPTAVSNAKKISYSVPTGWITTTDSSNFFQLSYDTTKLKTCYPDQKGIFLCAQYGSYISSSILPYDGGSKHQFIYSNGLGTPRKDELWSDYREQEYNFDGKSCLFLNGITISQYPTVWGMCALDNTRAVLFTSYDRTESVYEAILKTFKAIK